MTSIEIIGWCGTFFLSCCGIPQLIVAFKDDVAVRGMTYPYLYGWIIGIICMTIYIHLLPAKEYPYPLQVANAISLSCALMLLFLKRRVKIIPSGNTGI
jgi:uncharacterized protein with PQ loop repeat